MLRRNLVLSFGATFAIDADPAFTNRAKIHANK